MRDVRLCHRLWQTAGGTEGDIPIQATELETKRLWLKPLTENDLDAMHKLSIDPDVRKYLYADRIIPRQQVVQIIADSEACFQRFGTGFYGLYLKLPNHALDGQFCGFCGNRLFEGTQQMELLVGVDPATWGLGIGGEAAREVLRHCFEDCGIDEVVAAADTPNQRSVRMLQKLGMSFRERREWHGLDTMFYDINTDDFHLLQQ